LLFGCSKSRIRKIIGQKPADTLREELELIDEVYPKFDRQDYLDGKLQPVFLFCLKYFGVRELLDCLYKLPRLQDPKSPKRV
jgi:peptide chain release factor 3